MIRRLATLIAALALLVLAAGSASAGNWATIELDKGAGTVEPRETEPVELGFTVLQHGQTPAGWEQPTVIVENTATGERLEVRATPRGKDGHFVAALAFPEAGLWTWRIELRDLALEAPPAGAMSVLTADGRAPTVDPAGIARMIAIATEALRTELREVAFADNEELQSQLTVQASRIELLRAQLNEARASLETLEPAADRGGGLPLAGVILVSVLSGAAGAFLVRLLARPRRPSPIPIAPATPAAGGEPGYSTR